MVKYRQSIPLEKEAVFMDPTQTLELAQALKLSPTLLQSMNMLQMTGDVRFELHGNDVYITTE